MKTLFSAILLTSAFSLTATAAPQGRFEKADLNQDGVISQSEFVTQANQRFSQTDTNHDGQVSKDERKAAMQNKMRERSDKRFESIDANGDGSISKAENDQAMEKRMAKRAERAAAHKDAKKDKKKNKKKHNKKNRKDKDAQHKARFNPDTNGDGLISTAEHDAMVSAQFTRMDTNQDGVLDKTELKRKMTGRHHPKKFK